jgi:hypothetical protein
LRAGSAEGRTPYFFAHYADDIGAPALGRLLQEKLHALASSLSAPLAWRCELQSRPAV